MLKPILMTLGLGLGGTLALAAGLVLTPWSESPTAKGGLDFTTTLAAKNEPIPTEALMLRDGHAQSLRYLQGPAGGPLVVMLHGSGWHGMQFEGLGRQLANSADVAIPDLRGHGQAPARRGDLDYIGQFEDDIADLIAVKARPGQKVILLGHSSGGGLVVRFAGGKHRDLIAGAVLLAPFLQHDAPTTRPNSGGWAQVNLRRMIGLSILNLLGISAFNGQPVIRFAMPAAVLDGPLGLTATTEYSYRLNTSFAPRRNWQQDLAKLPPFLLIAGSEDEAFHATLYQPTLSALNAGGQYLIVPGQGHLGIVDAPQTAKAVAQFMGQLK